MNGRAQQTGFTIVELLIVVVVIAILAAITIVSYNGIQERALNTARIDEAKKWQTHLLTYAQLNSGYPDALLVNQNACLGEGFPDNNGDGIGNCWDLHSSNATSERASLNTQLKTVGALPNNTRVPIPGSTAGTSRIGPVLERTGGDVYQIVYWLKGTSGTCPLGVPRWNDGRSFSCTIALPAF